MIPLMVLRRKKRISKVGGNWLRQQELTNATSHQESTKLFYNLSEFFLMGRSQNVWLIERSIWCKMFKIFVKQFMSAFGFMFLRWPDCLLLVLCSYKLKTEACEKGSSKERKLRRITVNYLYDFLIQNTVPSLRLMPHFKQIPLWHSHRVCKLPNRKANLEQLWNVPRVAPRAPWNYQTTRKKFFRLGILAILESAAVEYVTYGLLRHSVFVWRFLSSRCPWNLPGTCFWQTIRSDLEHADSGAWTD